MGHGCTRMESRRMARMNADLRCSRDIWTYPLFRAMLNFRGLLASKRGCRVGCSTIKVAALSRRCAQRRDTEYYAGEQNHHSIDGVAGLRLGGGGCSRRAGGWASGRNACRKREAGPTANGRAEADESDDGKEASGRRGGKQTSSHTG